VAEEAAAAADQVRAEVEAAEAQVSGDRPLPRLPAAAPAPAADLLNDHRTAERG
jgi:hypothetical protein